MKQNARAVLLIAGLFAALIALNFLFFVEKSAEEWLAYYRKGNDKPSAPPLVVIAPTGPKNLTLGEIARNGTDFRDLMKDLDRKVGPAPVRNGDLVGILSSRCGLSPDSLSCREFKPLFRDVSSCGAHLSMPSCVVDDKCRWFLNSCTSKP